MAGMGAEVKPSCPIMLVVTVPMLRMLIRNNHVASKVLLLPIGMYLKVCWFLSLRVEVLGVVVCGNPCWRVAKGLWGGVFMFNGDCAFVADLRRVACGRSLPRCFLCEVLGAGWLVVRVCADALVS